MSGFDLRDHDPVMIAAALFAGIFAGLALGWLLHGSAPDAAAGNARAYTVTGAVPGVPTIPGPASDPGLAETVRRALRQAIRSSSGRMEAAVMFDDSTAPIAAGDARTGQMRTWSMIKPVTAVALLAQPAAAGNRKLDPFLAAALRRSENCAQRKLTLELRGQLGGGNQAVRDVIAATLRKAGATIDVAVASTNQDPSGDQTCADPGYPRRLVAAEASTTNVLQLGTTTWSPIDAVRFIAALRAGRAYGQQVSQRVLELLRRPKLPSEEVGANDLQTAGPRWGAGQVFTKACWRVAYKGGWGGGTRGGQIPGRYLAGQIGTVELRGGRWAAFAVMFHPTRQPPSDDPGVAGADVAIEHALRTLQRLFQRQFGGCG